MALPALMLAACGGLDPVEGASVSPSQTDGRITARALLGEDQETRTVPLASAQGLTIEHQEAINRAVDAGCATGVLTQRECDDAFEARLARMRMGDL